LTDEEEGARASAERAARVYICGLRIHEFALGFGVLGCPPGRRGRRTLGRAPTGAARRWLLRMVRVRKRRELTNRAETAALFSTWLVGKDWRDLFRSKRNTASWRLLPHRVPRD